MDISAANWIDLVTLALILISVAFGLVRGFFGAVWSLMALVFSFIIAKDFGHKLLPTVRTVLDDSPLANPLAMLLVFIGVYIIFQLVAHLTHNLISALNLGGFNRIGGMFFGLLRGVALSCLFVLLLSMVGMANTAVWKEAQSPRYLGAGIRTVSNILPMDEHKKWLRFDRASRPYLVTPDDADIPLFAGSEEKEDGGDAEAQQPDFDFKENLETVKESRELGEAALEELRESGDAAAGGGQ